jgi:hypothetical protein
MGQKGSGLGVWRGRHDSHNESRARHSQTSSLPVTLIHVITNHKRRTKMASTGYVYPNDFFCHLFSPRIVDSTRRHGQTMLMSSVSLCWYMNI